MSVKVILKDGDEMSFASYGFENNNILHLHGTVSDLQEHISNMSKLDSENARELYLVSPDIKNWAQLEQCSLVSEQKTKVPISEDESVIYVDYYLESVTPANKAIEVLDIMENGVLDAELLAEIEEEKSNG